MLEEKQTSRIRRWRAVALTLLVIGYAGYYLCRSNLSVVMPLMISDLASGIIDGVGYLGGVLAGDTVARISVIFGWQGAFTALAGVALLSSLAAALFLLEQRRPLKNKFGMEAA
jgi:sugar phosphate permease